MIILYILYKLYIILYYFIYDSEEEDREEEERVHSAGLLVKLNHQLLNVSTFSGVGWLYVWACSSVLFFCS